MRPRWSSGPEEINLVRHGESMGNLADARACDAGAEQLELDDRDADVELTDSGRRQANALNAWLAGDGASSLPTAAISSPYRRATDTAYRARRAPRRRGCSTSGCGSGTSGSSTG